MISGVTTEMVGAAVLGAGVMLSVAWSAKKLFFREPPFEAEFASKKDLLELSKKVDALEKCMNEGQKELLLRIETRLSDQDIKQERRSAAIHDRINAIAEAVSSLRGRMNL